MIKHVVIWKLNNIDDAQRLKEDIESLSGKIPGLISIEAGININKSDVAGDLILISSHTDSKALAEYQINPFHVEVKNRIVLSTGNSTVVDFEI